MAVNEPMHRDRARAESFGSVAADYDRYRPSYPGELVDDLVALRPERVLDVACGTGKLAVLLTSRGIPVLGVEVDPQMAQVARCHGVAVEDGAFETWDDRGRSFDLITCGQGWHWIDPDVGNEKAARLLTPGGTLALMWNHDELDEDVRAAIERVYREHGPELFDVNRAHDDDPFVERLEATGKFADVTRREYRWSAEVSADEWIGRTATFSDHIRLPAEHRDALFAAVRTVIDERGGSVRTHYRTYTIFARTAGE